MFWNKIPKGYVETVDGYIVKESECKVVKEHGIDVFYQKENAPKYDRVRRVHIPTITDAYSCMLEFYKEVQVKEDSTPIGYHTKEEVEELRKEIKELKDEYEPGLVGELGGVGVYAGMVRKLDETMKKEMGEYYPEEVKKGEAPKKKTSPKRKNGKRKTKANPKGAGRPKGSKNKK